MKLQADGKTLPVMSAMIVDNVRQYYSTLEVVLPCRIPEINLTMENNGTTVKLVVMKCHYDSSGYNYTLVAKDTFDLLDTTFTGFTGKATLKQLLARVGLSNVIATDSVSSYWRIPECKLLKLFEYLSYYTEFNGGGSPMFYIDIQGKVRCFDLAAISLSSPRQVNETITSDIFNRDWVLHYPGVVDLYVHSPEGSKKEKLTFKKGYGRGSFHVNETTGEERGLAIRKLKNTFFSKYYMARQMNVESVTNVYNIGELVRINGVSNFIVTGRIVSVADNNPGMSITLSSPYENN